MSFEFSDHIQLKKKKSKKKEKTEVNRRKGTISHRGGAWDGSVIKKKSIVIVYTLDCKCGINILYGV